MLLEEFNYTLPPSLIAQKPHYKRGGSRLLTINKESGQILDDYYKNLPAYLNKGDVVVLNNTKVFKARIRALKANGAPRELVILEKHGQKDNWHKHKVMYRGHLTVGDILKVDNYNLRVEKLNNDGTAIVSSQTDLLKLANKYGTIPLPPYIKRQTIKSDEATYQTVWAKCVGSVAAPTASLNMTKSTLDILKAKGVKIVYITLHVGLGTFLPIRTEKLEDHKMHNEFFEIPKNTFEAIKQAKANKNKVLAVGTTVARTLEYNKELLLNESATKLCGEANIFIYPGYSFKIVDMLLTNFHAPKTSVLMMAAAFAGWNNLKQAYEHAKANGYWFLSYGDSMLIK